MTKPPSRIVTTHYRYKRPPPKRKPAALEVPAVVTKATRVAKAERPIRVIDSSEGEPLVASDPSRDRKPAIVTPGKGRAGNDNRAETFAIAARVNAAPTTIVRAKPRRRSAFGDVPDMTPEEHQRRGDAAAALWRDMVRRAAEE